MGEYRIGLIAGNKSDDYNRAIRLGVQNTLEEAGETLVNIADLVPYHTNANTETYLRVAFEIAGRLDLDLVVVPMGVVSGYLEYDATLAQEFLKVLDPKKTLVIERSIPGFRCISKDNLPGMHECMRHLIETCGYTRIAFISGPDSSVGAHEREGVYFAEMEAHGLEVPDGYFLRGKYSGHCHDVVEGLLDAHPEVEAIACASDNIAYAVYQVTRGRKLAVGADIAVTGFDDQQKSAHLDPPLSTVHMTGYDLGCMGGREALRMCRHEPQREFVMSSSFVARSSCGELAGDVAGRGRELLRREAFPIDEVADILVDATLYLAGPTIRQNFRAGVMDFLAKIRAAYRVHKAHPDEDVALFSSQDLSVLFSRDYREHLSLEGFHAVAISLLEALLAESPEDEVGWVVNQISYLHLRVARMIDDARQTDMRDMNEREWLTLHITEDSLVGANHPRVAYGCILKELANLGVRRADYYMLPTSVTCIGGRSFALSDSIRHIGGMAEGEVSVPEQPQTFSLQNLMTHVVSRYQSPQVITVGGVMAGNELLGVLTMDPGSLDENGQLMVMLNVGLSCKYLQMLANEREMNELLSKNNLVLERQSQRDEMTGLLNRRGLNDGMMHALRAHPKKLCTLVYLDLDGLKFINDTLGHDAGDDAIRATAEVMKETLPSTCLLARMGGDEFVIFSQVSDELEAHLLVESLQRGVDRRNAHRDLPFDLSISSGLECFYVGGSPEDDITRAMVHADERMYEMKKRRRQSRSFEG